MAIRKWINILDQRIKIDGDVIKMHTNVVWNIYMFFFHLYFSLSFFLFHTWGPQRNIFALLSLGVLCERCFWGREGVNLFLEATHVVRLLNTTSCKSDPFSCSKYQPRIMLCVRLTYFPAVYWCWNNYLQKFLGAFSFEIPVKHWPHFYLTYML